MNQLSSVIPEAFLHFLWHTKRFDQKELRTTEGLPVQLIDSGQWNHHAGPDFLHARVRIDDTLWVGNVEMHLNASDWLQHRHQEDPAYENVILHVVLVEDVPIFRRSGDRIPCVELSGRIPAGLLRKFRQLRHTLAFVPCQAELPEVSPLILQSWLDRLAVERLEAKTVQLEECLEACRHDWEEMVYREVGRCLGYSVNSQPFAWLTAQLPLSIVRRYRDRPLSLEALVFGQAGFLERHFVEEYPQQLQREYRFLQKKHHLQPLDPAVWKFARMRPANFPTLRLAQLAALLLHRQHWLANLLDADSPEAIADFFEAETNPYWHWHYRFEQSGKSPPRHAGLGMVGRQIVNVIAPVLFLYGQRKEQKRLQQRALDLLEALPPEDNRIIRYWRQLGIMPATAFHTQALLQLKEHYCSRQRCLECAVGREILIRSSE